MSHTPEDPERFVCESCQITHAGTPVHSSDGGHSYEPPEACGGCGETSFVAIEDWPHHHG